MECLDVFLQRALIEECLLAQFKEGTLKFLSEVLWLVNILMLKHVGSGCKITAANITNIGLNPLVILHMSLQVRLLCKFLLASLIWAYELLNLIMCPHMFIQSTSLKEFLGT
jgi:hypothetical protein